jgi:hypothetical protein
VVEPEPEPVDGQFAVLAGYVLRVPLLEAGVLGRARGDSFEEQVGGADEAVELVRLLGEGAGDERGPAAEEVQDVQTGRVQQRPEVRVRLAGQGGPRACEPPGEALRTEAYGLYVVHVQVPEAVQGARQGVRQFSPGLLAGGFAGARRQSGALGQLRGQLAQILLREGALLAPEGDE